MSMATQNNNAATATTHNEMSMATQNNNAATATTHNERDTILGTERRNMTEAERRSLMKMARRHGLIEIIGQLAEMVEEHDLDDDAPLKEIGHKLWDIEDDCIDYLTETDEV